MMPLDARLMAFTADMAFYPEGFLERSGASRIMSGNILLNTSPLILSGSSFGESYNWVSSFLAEASGSGDFASSGIIPAP